MGNYVDVADLRVYHFNGVCVDLSLISDSEITSKIALAEEAVEAFTGVKYYPQTLTFYFDGTGYDSILFHEQTALPNISVSSVEEIEPDGTVLDTLVENTDFIRYDDRLEIARCRDYSARRRFTSFGVWPRGQKNIKIVGSWGVTTTPEAIKEATKLLALSSLVPSQIALNPTGVRRVRFPDYEVEFGHGLADKETQTTGFQEIDTLLIPYVKVSLFLRVVPNSRGAHS
jgi:hypothetical protein